MVEVKEKLLTDDGDVSMYSTASSNEYAFKIPNEALNRSKSPFDNEYDENKILPPKTQALFSWSHINAFILENEASGLKDKALTSLGKKEVKPKCKHILQNMNGTAYPGELLVMMGSSGAGKTTLLNCMTFRNLKGLLVSGMITINNKPVDQTALASQSAYVQQDDHLMGCLTVREHLIFQALVRINSDLTYEERLDRVEEVMKDLSLKKCENCFIGVPGIVKGISGGERKRVSLASEFLTNPSILFCDEPTTGLDSFMALNVMHMLKDIARSGRTVITTLHQPSSETFQLIDKLCLVAQGRTAFLGTLLEAENFFANNQCGACPRNFNPADYYIQVLSLAPGDEKICTERIQRICDAFENSRMGVDLENKADAIMKSKNGAEEMWSPGQSKMRSYKVGWYAQLNAVFWRSWLTLIRDPVATKQRFKTVLVESLFIMVIYFGQRISQEGITNLDGVIYYLLTSTTYQDVFGIINIFCGEIPLFIKEHKDGLYRPDVYFLSKSITAIPVTLFLSTFKIGIIYFAVGMNPEFERFLTALCILMLIGLASQGIGFIVSTTATSVQLAPPLTSVFITPFLLLGGIFLNFRTVTPLLRWLADFSWIRFGHEAFMVNQWSNVFHIPCGFSGSESSMCIRNGIEVLHSVSISKGDLLPAIGALIALCILFRIIAFMILLYRASRKD